VARIRADRSRVARIRADRSRVARIRADRSRVVRTQAWRLRVTCRTAVGFARVPRWSSVDGGTSSLVSTNSRTRRATRVTSFAGRTVKRRVGYIDRRVFYD